MYRNRRNNRGFTLAELLIVVAIIAVLVAISIPIFTSQLEKSREATDLANVRSAYAEVMTTAIVQDTSSALYTNGVYRKKVPLKQKQNDWQMDKNKLTVGGISASILGQWKGTPKAGGSCTVSYSDDKIILNWSGEDHINVWSAADFLTKDILKDIVGDNYQYQVINSNESYKQGGGTKKFLDYAKEHGFDLEDYDAKTWQIYVKENSGSNSAMLEEPAIYWSTVDVKDVDDGKYVPVMGYRDGKYDVYYAKVETYNQGTDNEYKSIHNGFANVKNDGSGSATFEYDTYEDAKEHYDKILEVYNQNKNLTSSDLAQNGIK